MYITGEFSSFLMSHLMQVFKESFKASRDLYIRGLREEELSCANEVLPRVRLMLHGRGI